MKWLLKPIMRPIARRKLAEIYEELDRLESASCRAEKDGTHIRYLLGMRDRKHVDRRYWAGWL
jgi:hypothetical protein